MTLWVKAVTQIDVDTFVCVDKTGCPAQRLTWWHTSALTTYCSHCESYIGDVVSVNFHVLKPVWPAIDILLERVVRLLLSNPLHLHLCTCLRYTIFSLTHILLIFSPYSSIFLLLCTWYAHRSAAVFVDNGVIGASISGCVLDQLDGNGALLISVTDFQDPPIRTYSLNIIGNKPCWHTKNRCNLQVWTHSQSYWNTKVKNNFKCTCCVLLYFFVFVFRSNLRNYVHQKLFKV